MAKKVESNVTIKWTGNAGIEEAAALKDELIAAFKKSSSIELDLSEVEDIDTTGIQIILAAKKEAELQKKVFFVKENVPQKLIDFAIGFGIELNKFNLQQGDSNA